MALVVVGACGLCADKLVSVDFHPLLCKSSFGSRKLLYNGGNFRRGNGGNVVRAVLVESSPSQAQQGKVELQATVQRPEQLGLADTNLISTTEHRVWVGAAAAAVLGMLTKAVTASHSLEDGLAIGLSAVAAYVLADLGTGVYHWGVDNYGDANTPIFGSQIDAFQGHHKRPWTITKRQFANNIHAIARPVFFTLVPFLLLPSDPVVDTFFSLFLANVVLSQQFHAWSHTKKSQLPPLVAALQDAGILLSRKMHGAHHRSPYDINYCIVSGLWNPLLNESRFFPLLEAFIHSRYGVAPRSWSETQTEWLQDGSYFEDGTEIGSSGQQQES